MLDAWATTTTPPGEAPGGAIVEQLPIGASSRPNAHQRNPAGDGAS